MNQNNSPQTKQYQQILFQGKKTFQCLHSGCEKIFKFKSDMERHVLSHTKEKPIICPYPSCNKSFKRQYSLRYHIETNHLESTELSCPLGCPLKFSNRISLRLHLGKHEFIKGQETSFNKEIFESIYDQFTKENRELKQKLSSQIDLSKDNDKIDQDFEAWAKKKFKLDENPSQGSQNSDATNFQNTQGSILQFL